MHDYSFFLLKNWLPVGLAAIVFFVIGLLLAKFIWGRYSNRLSYAVEENLNLAGQWSSLGSSQRDLFKKLRSRWQADRESWELTISAKERQISDLTAQLHSSGKTFVLNAEGSDEALVKVSELEALLSKKEAKIAELLEDAEAQAKDDQEERAMAVTRPIQPASLLASPENDSEALQQKIKDLEQDLINTHDELHEVRDGYRKQVELVESLEGKLIEAPDSNGELVESDSRILELKNELAALAGKLQTESRKGAQFSALFTQRNRELFSVRERFAISGGISGGNTNAFEVANAELVRKLKSEIDQLKNELGVSNEEVARLQGDLDSSRAELEANSDRLATLEDLERRKSAMQAELNDACHEMYDVRSALRNRLDEIEILEAAFDESEALGEVHEGVEQELSDARHELSDVRLAFNASEEALSKANAEMEELEAIIEDRGAEVTDLSTEVRQQRDLVRELKNTLAEQEGELEALNEESSGVSSVLNAKTTLLTEHEMRIADLESALVDRYKELNAVRVESSDHSFAAKYHESRADQLESELDRRSAIFDKSDKRVATAEESLLVANEKIEELSQLLSSSEASISELREALNEVSTEKDQKIRDLENASSRVQILEEAAREREEKLSRIEFDLQTSRSEASDFSSRLARITSEIEEARKEQKLSESQVSQLEKSLSDSDSKTLQLSQELETKEGELDQFTAKLSELKESLESSEASATEAEIRISTLKSDMEEKVKALMAENSELNSAAMSEEGVESLQKEVASLRSSLNSYTKQREGSILEIERLRGKVGARGDSIRELKGQLSNIMMQRSSRDDEISLLKDKLKAVEAELKASDASAKQTLQFSEPGDEQPIDLESAIKSTLSQDSASDGGTSLDDLGEKQGHHNSPQEPEPVAPVAEEEPVKETRGQDDDSAIYFDEGAANLSDSELEKIDHCARLARRSRGKLAVTVIGFAGSEGSSNFNESLSARRAEAVRERLLERGVTQSNVKVRNAGQDRRFSDWKARRVELVVAPKAVAETVN